MTLAPDEHEYYYQFCFVCSFAIIAISILYFIMVRPAASPRTATPQKAHRACCLPPLRDSFGSCWSGRGERQAVTRHAEGLLCSLWFVLAHEFLVFCSRCVCRPVFGASMATPPLCLVLISRVKNAFF